MLEQGYKMYEAAGLTWSDASMWEQFEHSCQESPGALAVVDAQGRCWTRAEMFDMAVAASQSMETMGVGPHQRVLLEGRKNAPTLAAALAISRLRGVICPFTPDLGKAERQILEERLGHAAVIGDSDPAGTPLPQMHGLRLSRREGSSEDERNRSAALIGFTSGTTGVPKGVMHSSAAMNYAVRACEHIAGLAAEDAIIGVVPLGSAPGFTFTAHFGLAHRHPLVLIDPWDPLQTLTMMEKHACRWGICVPTQLLALIEAAKSGRWTLQQSPIKALAVGGSAMTPQMVSDAESLLGIQVLRMFGMSECMGHASTRLQDSMERRMNSDGAPFPGTSDEAFDADLRILPRGARGQAGVRGPSQFIGYCKGLGDQDYRLTPDGYYLTGDEIICDEDGYLKVVGRIKDQIIRGGYNIDPAEVEAALLQHGALEKVAVVAVPEARLGEQACAVCCIRPGYETPTLADLKEHLGAIGLSKKKWPEHLLVVKDMAYTTTGKIDKKQMAKLAIAELGLS